MRKLYSVPKHGSSDLAVQGGKYLIWILDQRLGRLLIEGIQALDVLSRQPNIPPPLNLDTPVPESQFFEFDTTNLFLLGSPAGFFLLLERGSLTPRKGRDKPGAEAAVSIF